MKAPAVCIPVTSYFLSDHGASGRVGDGHRGGHGAVVVDQQPRRLPLGVAVQHPAVHCAPRTNALSSLQKDVGRGCTPICPVI